MGIKIQEKVSLGPYTTMRVGGNAAYFCTVTTVEELQEVVAFKNKEDIPHFILGGGSNTVFTGDFNGLVIKNEIKGIQTIEENEHHAILEAGGGEQWHTFVEYCVDRDLAGNENLALIPGTVGAAPVQNIAAYGQVQEDTFISLTAINLETGEIREFQEPECEFSYRTSIFKNAYQDTYCVTQVKYQLKKVINYTPDTTYYSRYESLSQFLPKNKESLSVRDIFNAVVAIRKYKLPQPDEVGTVGSFFVNPFVTKAQLTKLQKQFPGLQYYPVDKMQYPGLDDEVFKDADVFKIPIAWLIQELGWRYEENGTWKGKKKGNVGISPKHSLNIIVTGEASGAEVRDFAQAIQQDIFEKTGLHIESEVRLV